MTRFETILDHPVVVILTNRRDMEPPLRVLNDLGWYFELESNTFTRISFSNDMLIVTTITATSGSLFSSLRIRGGMDNPNVDNKSADIPYLTEKKFIWDGLPCIDFIEKVVFPIENGLATMTVKGYSLLDTCRQTDAGGVFGNPPRAVAPADVIAESIHRNQKAFACIMNYTSRNCWFYRHANRSQQLQQNGIHLLRALRNHGVVQIPPRVLKAREDAWARMSMETLRIPNDVAGYFKWADIVVEAGRKLQVM